MNSKPWLNLYPDWVPSQVDISDSDLISQWDDRVRRDPGHIALIYFDHKWSAQQLDDASDALAVALCDLGVSKGAHVGIYLQNVPAYPVALLALWKLGAVALILNPMYKGRELRHLIDDAQAVGLIHTDSNEEVLAETLNGSTVNWRISTSGRDQQSRNDPRIFPDSEIHSDAPQGNVWRLIDAYRGRKPTSVSLTGDDIAILAYTSGTTGPAKGAMNTHRNVLSVLRNYARWARLGPVDVVFAMAPLFHITGAVVNCAVALIEGSALVLINRFHPEIALEAFVEYGVTNTVGSITAYIAMSQVPWADRKHFTSARLLFSGGAPIPPATIEHFEERFGHYIYNAYGMTETTSGVIAVPPGRRAPIYKPSGTLSIGVPWPGIDVKVIDSHGEAVPPGTEGELEIAGPAVIPAYWHNPEATRLTMPEGHLRTGDGAVIDASGWVYLVDRIKDQINVSGYKVWPREVEDVLYENPAVLEAAVVGVQDKYQGESVVAFVSLKENKSVTPESLRLFIKSRLAAYKVPKQVRLMSALPKTLTGKIQRNVLRDMKNGSIGKQ